MVERALQAAGVPMHPKGIAGYQIDSSVEDLGQWFWSPRATVKGTKRDAAPKVLRETPYLPVELAAFAPPETSPVKRLKATPTRTFPTLAAAREAFNADHMEDWDSHKGTCPLCGHHDCFGPLPQIPAKWFCWSANHTEGVGQRTDRGWFGDALDIAAHLASRSTTEHLRSEGYLAAAPAREEPGCDDGDEPPPPIEENPRGPGGRSTDGAPVWAEPIPFDRISVPDFPTQLLPDWQRRFVESVALETETKPDLAAMCALTATATTCARRFVIEQRPGFNVPANLWTLTMMSSGNRKSAVFDRAVAPLRAYESQKEEELAPRIATEASARRRLEKKLQKAEKAAAEAREELARKAAAVEADVLAEELARFRVTRAPRMFLSEASPERLEEVLMEQGGRAAVLAAEPALFRALAGLGSRNSADPNLTSILDAYDGGDVRVGRMKRDDGSGGDRIVRGAAVTIGLAPQPERVFTALRAGPAFLESGFAWRFLFALPESLLGRRTHATPPAPDSVLAEYSARMRELLELPEPSGDTNSLPIVQPTPEAREALLAFERRLEPAMAEGGQLVAAVPWASKLTSKLARIAGLLHAAEHRREPWLSPLELRTMERAIALAEYFIPHARSVLLELGADDTVRRGRRVIEWIRREKPALVSKRDLHRAVAKNEQAGSWLDRLVQLLVDHEYLRAAPTTGPRPAHRPGGPQFEVNPKVFEATNGR